MNKEEILAKSRNENKDEGFTVAENKGRIIGISTFCLVFIFIVIFSFFNGISSSAPSAMFWAFMAASAYPQYKFTKNKTYLITTIAGALVSIMKLAIFVIEVLG